MKKDMFRDQRRKRRIIAVLTIIIILLLGTIISYEAWLDANWFSLWLRIALYLAFIASITGIVLVLNSGIAGGPRFRKVRFFNPAGRLLRKVEARKVPPSVPPPPPPPDPQPVWMNIPPNPLFGQPPWMEEVSYDLPYDKDVKRLDVTIETDDPVLTASFTVEIDPEPENDVIEELDIFTYEDEEGTLRGFAWVLHGSVEGGPLMTSLPRVTFVFA